MAEGVGHGGVGGSIRAEDVLKPQWREHLEICKCEWLIDVVKRATDAGEIVTPEMLEAAWRDAP